MSTFATIERNIMSKSGHIKMTYGCRVGLDGEKIAGINVLRYGDDKNMTPIF